VSNKLTYFPGKDSVTTR